ncbi:hypothetical protein [Aequorivita capsosiphonis]|uniref:hypothetical protein n=1 Tax=Aequorivita capsosiphonis TaxID=487317 RepID=UPI00041002D3|nr:hypothetical protein [Aequorivita capsosiphonis]
MKGQFDVEVLKHSRERVKFSMDKLKNSLRKSSAPEASGYLCLESKYSQTLQH